MYAHYTSILEKIEKMAWYQGTQVLLASYVKYRTAVWYHTVQYVRKLILDYVLAN